MAQRFYTLVVVPHAKARYRQFQVSVRLAKAGLAGAVVAALVLAGVLLHYSQIVLEVRHLRDVDVQNQRLVKTTQVYEENAARLHVQVAELEKAVSKLGVMAGLEQLPPDARIGGVGGVSYRESTAPLREAASLASMRVSVSRLTERSAELAEFYRDRATLLASTPSVWPVRGYLSAGFGNRKDPFTGQPDFHPGIDVSTPKGTHILAPADGLVVFCGRRGGYGNAIVVDHGYGVVTRYAHLSRFNVKAGQRVKRGSLIGFVGNTGKSTAPHLHYEVWVKDRAQNPIHYILDEYRSFG